MICKHNLSNDKKVHLGFWKTLNKENLFDILKNELNKNLAQYPDYELYLTGHSLEGGLATLFGYLFGLENNKNINIITFASPRVGNDKWANEFNQMKNIRHYRIVNENDIVTAIPYLGFYHCGNEIRINSRKKN